MASSTSNKDVVDIEINYHKVTNKVDDSFIGIKSRTIELIFIILKHITLMSHLLKIKRRCSCDITNNINCKNTF